MERITTLQFGTAVREIRTSGTTAAKLERTHTAAVRAAAVALRTEAYAQHLSPELAARKAHNATKAPTTGLRERSGGRGLLPATDWVRTGPTVYVTAEVARAMGLEEWAEEVLPGLAVVRGGSDGRRWHLRHLRTYADASHEAKHLGPVFKTRERAVDVTLAELAHLDWTRTAEALLADPLSAATVRLVLLREFVTASKKNAWATDRLEKAEADLARVRARMKGPPPTGA